MIVVSGAAGMLGQAVLPVLVQRGYQVRGIWHRREPEFTGLTAELIQADLRDLDQAISAMQGAETLVMCAVVTGGASYLQNNFWIQVRENLQLFVNQLQAAVQTGVKQIIFVGSATIYQELSGNIQETDLDCNCPPAQIYAGIGNVMRFVESLLLFLAKKQGVTTVALRCANIYGPGDRFAPEMSNVVPALLRKAVERQDPFEVWGDPGVVRDLVYVEDVAVLVRILLEKYDRTRVSDFQVFNVGANKGTTIGQLVQAVLEVSGYQGARVCYRRDRPVTVHKRVLNCDLVKSALDWEATTPLRLGLTKTLMWYEENRTRWTR